MPDLTVPGRSAAVITLDAVIVDCRALWVGAAGNVAVDMKGTGTSIVFIGVPAGTLLPIQANKVLTTGTTVASPTTNILALW